VVGPTAQLGEEKILNAGEKKGKETAELGERGAQNSAVKRKKTGGEFN